MTARLFAEGLAHHQSGRVCEAVQCYQQVLRQDPGHADALHLLGVAMHQLGNDRLALDLIGQAIAIAPAHAEAAANQGAIRKQTGNLERALMSLGRALALDPGHVEAHVNRAAVQIARGRFDDGLMSAGHALAMRPDHVEALMNRGTAQLKRGRLELALADSQAVCRLRPGHPDGHYNLGNTYQAMGRIDEAIACYRRALDLNPQFAAALNNLGTAFQAADQAEAALACFLGLADLQAADAEVHSNCGIALKDLGRLTEAMARFRRAIALRPEYPEAYNNLGLTLLAAGELDDARRNFRHALALRPRYPEAHSNLLLALQYDHRATGADILVESRNWARRNGVSDAPPRFANDPRTDRPLRIGFVSPDFRTHSVSYFFEPLLEAHDRRQFAAFCYSDVVRADNTTKRLETAADGWRQILGRSDDDVGAQIRADGIDILVDLAGHFGNRRLGLFARRAAPVQVTWLGYPGTTGIERIDWRLTDEISDPVGAADQEHVERLWRLPSPFLCYRPAEGAGPVANLPARRAGHVCFGSFNNFPKISSEILRVWAEILARVPGSRLLLKSASLADAAVVARLRRTFAECGVSPDRIEAAPWIADSAAHLGLYSQVDIALDTFPYHGTTTTCEALWSGVPVLSLIGTRHAARVGASLLHAVGLPELAVGTPGDYVRGALALAQDLDRLCKLRSEMRSRMAASRLCDGPLLASAMADAFCGMWRRWRETGKS